MIATTPAHGRRLMKPVCHGQCDGGEVPVSSSKLSAGAYLAEEPELAIAVEIVEQERYVV